LPIDGSPAGVVTVIMAVHALERISKIEQVISDRAKNSFEPQERVEAELPKQAFEGTQSKSSRESPSSAQP